MPISMLTARKQQEVRTGLAKWESMRFMPKSKIRVVNSEFKLKNLQLKSLIELIPSPRSGSLCKREK